MAPTTKPLPGVSLRRMAGRQARCAPARTSTTQARRLLARRQHAHGQASGGGLCANAFWPDASGQCLLALMAWLARRKKRRRAHGPADKEDLDPRSWDREVSRLLMDDLHWLGLDWDEGPYFQKRARRTVRRQSSAWASRGSPTHASARVPSCMPQPRRMPRTAPILMPGNMQKPLARGGCQKGQLRPPAARLRVPEAMRTPRASSPLTMRLYGHCSEVLARECGISGAQERRRDCLPACSC